MGTIPKKSCVVLVSTFLLAGCGAGQTARVASLKGAVDASATTACGKTAADQRKIDRTTESGFRAGLWDRPAANPNC